MSAAADRIWSAHPLAANHRLVLLAIERTAENGRAPLFNRKQLAEALELSKESVNRALTVGEAMGLCEIDKSGRVSFTVTDALPLDLNGGAAPAVGAAATDGAAPAAPPKVEKWGGREVLETFGRAWTAKYEQRFVVDNWPRDMKIANVLARALTKAELQQRLSVYMNHADPFYEQCCHAFTMFAKRINEFIPPPTPKPSRRGAGHIMSPEETQAYVRSMRGSA